MRNITALDSEGDAETRAKEMRAEEEEEEGEEEEEEEKRRKRRKGSISSHVGLEGVYSLVFPFWFGFCLDLICRELPSANQGSAHFWIR